MKALESNIKNDHTFILCEEETTTLSETIKDRSKDEIIKYVASGIDVILATSMQRDVAAAFLENSFKHSSDEIRTIFLNRDFFPADSMPDLSMISAVVYESIHLDENFVIAVSDADQLPIATLDELLKLALGINSNKNNVSFILSGDNKLVSSIEQVSSIKQLSSKHCSLDRLTINDVETFIKDKQSDTEEDKKLRFNKFAVKKITTHASGSLLKASILLEWCRAYANYSENIKVTSGSIDELLNYLIRISQQTDSSLISDYPPGDFSFSDSPIINRDKSENVEFSREAIKSMRTPTKTPPSKPIDNQNSKTVYVERKDSVESESPNIYEKVMNDPLEEELINESKSEDEVTDTPIEQDSQAVDDNQNTIIENDTEDESIEVVLEENEIEYEDTYHIEAVASINEPIILEDNNQNGAEEKEDTSSLQKQHIQAPSKKRFNAFHWLFLLLIMVVGAYYAFVSYNLSGIDYRSYLNSILEQPSNSENSENSPIAPTSITLENLPSIEENDQTVQALLELARSQMDEKKLSTPPSDNALDTYRMVLQFNPKNQEALLGIKTIKDRYIVWAKQDISNNNPARAKYFLQRAIEISPDDSEPQQLLLKLN